MPQPSGAVLSYFRLRIEARSSLVSKPSDVSCQMIASGERSTTSRIFSSGMLLLKASLRPATS